MMLLPSTTEMYRALVERDASFEGLFYACVRTTGIFCRPTCHARKPKPENVEFASTIQEALHRGYRPCQLCEPMTAGPAAPNWLAPLLDEIKSHPDLKLRDHDLRVRGLDPVQVRRTFKRSFGMTFQAYQRARRLGTAMKALHGGARTLDAGLDAGFESDSGFREAFAKVFGDAPGRARDTALLVASWIETPLGPMLAIAGDEGLELLEFVDRRALETELRELSRKWNPSTRAALRLGSGRPERESRDARSGQAVAIVPGDHAILRRTAAQLAEYFAGTRREFDIPLKLQGSTFQVAAWQALREIPYGETRSYADMARRLGSPGAVRAIGRANGQNRLCVVVPCHRVIQADGSLCGYGGGRWRKQWLLEHERGGRQAV
jgi:AraC family transcriptional regulator, regulatory protein of adaptative response / methylated-DNA-[protein]-cysteine methyltransferase